MNKYIIIAIACISALTGYGLRSLIANKDLAEMQAAHDRHITTLTGAALIEQTRLQKEVDEQAKRYAAAETQYYGELRDAEMQIDKLRADVDAGRKRLLIRASCPASSNNLPETGTSTGVDNGASAELDESAEPAYYALRDGIARVTAQLSACQSRLR